MKVMVLGASGMVGKGALLEALDAPDVTHVLSVGRSPCGIQHPKLEELFIPDFFQLDAALPRLAGYDACLFCLGVSSAGMKEADYRRVTYDLTLGFAKAFLQQNPGSTFIYVSGAHTDSSEKGRSMWARVKGQTENALLALGFKQAFMFRPGGIEPRRGVKPRSRLYAAAMWIIPIMKVVVPHMMTRSDVLGRAVLEAVRHGSDPRVLEVADINRLGAGSP